MLEKPLRISLYINEIILLVYLLDYVHDLVWYVLLKLLLFPYALLCLLTNLYFKSSCCSQEKGLSPRHFFSQRNLKRLRRYNYGIPPSLLSLLIILAISRQSALFQAIIPHGLSQLRIDTFLSTTLSAQTGLFALHSKLSSKSALRLALYVF